MVTAVMTIRAFDMPAASGRPHQHQGRRAAPDVLDVPRHPVLYVLNLDTTSTFTAILGHARPAAAPVGGGVLEPQGTFFLDDAPARSGGPASSAARRPSPRSRAPPACRASQGHHRPAHRAADPGLSRAAISHVT